MMYIVRNLAMLLGIYSSSKTVGQTFNWLLLYGYRYDTTHYPSWLHRSTFVQVVILRKQPYFLIKILITPNFAATHLRINSLIWTVNVGIPHKRSFL